MGTARSARIAAVVLLAFSVLIVDLTVTPEPAAAVASAEADFVDKINAERQQRGLGKLQVNTALRGVARDWTDKMAACTRNRSRGACLEHNPDYSSQVTSRVTRDWTRLGENVGYTLLTGASNSQLVTRLHKALMNSDGHRRNILGDYNQIGVGVTVARDGSMWVTQNFMRAPLDGSQIKSQTIPVSLSSAAIPISGDWNGDGQATAGWYDNGHVYLRNTHGSGGAHISFTYGRSGDVPIVGDWNGNGRDTIGVLRDGVWYLRNSHKGGNADYTFRYGRLNSGDYALAGDWNGNGRDTIGIVRGGEWHLRDRLAGGNADRVFIYGRVRNGDVPVVGDWTGNGQDTPGIIRGSEWHLRDRLAGGNADRVFNYGISSDTPLVGNWNGRGATTPGIVRGTTWHLRNSNTGGGAHSSYDF